MVKTRNLVAGGVAIVRLLFDLIREILQWTEPIPLTTLHLKSRTFNTLDLSVNLNAKGINDFIHVFGVNLEGNKSLNLMQHIQVINQDQYISQYAWLMYYLIKCYMTSTIQNPNKVFQVIYFFKMVFKLLKGSCHIAPGGRMLGIWIYPNFWWRENLIIHTHILVSFRRDSSPNPSHSNTTLWHSNARFTCWSWSILFQVRINQKSLEYFLPIHQAVQNGRPKVVSCLDLCL